MVIGSSKVHHATSNRAEPLIVVAGLSDHRLSEYFLGFASARHLNRDAGQALGGTAAAWVDDQGERVRYCGRSSCL